MNRMRWEAVLVALGALAVLFNSGQSAQAQTVVGTKHDLSSAGPGATTNTTEVCVFCHTPHQSGTTVDPLWNHTLSATASYGVYASSTFNGSSTITDIGGGTGVSNLCMSCHDGTVAVHSLYNPPNATGAPTITAGGNVTAAGLITGTPNLGTDLSNDHPVNFTYDAALVTADGGLKDPTTLTGVRLFAGTVQCASCHNPHDNVTGQPFLRATNAASALCLRCHNK